MENLETLKQDIEKSKKQKGIPEISIKTVNVLFLDISSTCTGYTIASFNIGDKAAPVVIKSAGCLWFGSDWDHQEKYSYMFNAVLTYFEIVEQIDLIIYEQYSVNPDRMSGVLTIPELIGCIKVAAKENGVKVDYIPPQTWRAQLGIKPVITEINGKRKRDYKQPTKDLMNKLIKTIPEEVTSNITNKKRSTPSDLYDSLGLCLGWLKKNGYSKIVYDQVQYDKHIGHKLKD